MRSALTCRQRAMSRGLGRGRKAAFICINGVPVSAALYTVKAVKRATVRFSPLGSVSLSTFTAE